MTANELTVRRATGHDAMDVARVHVASWQRAYRGVVPDEVLDTMDVAARANRYTFDDPATGSPTTWVALDGDDVVGFVSLGAARDEEVSDAGEVQALYVAPAWWRRGAGTRLLDWAEGQLVAGGHALAVLWVLEDNRRGRDFYEARGWVLDGARTTFEVGAHSLGELRYRKALARRAVPEGPA